MEKKIITFILVVAMMTAAISVGICLFYDPNPNLYTGYVYTKGESFDDGIASGYTWNYSGVEKTFGYSELERMAQSHRCCWRMDSGKFGIGITLNDSVALVVYGDQEKLMKLTDHWYLTF